MISKAIYLNFFLLLTFSVFSQSTITYWPNGKKKEQGVLKDSCKIGLWKSWNENGTLADSGEYVPASLNTVLIYGYDERYGKIDTLALKKNIIKNLSLQKGQWCSFHENGKLREEGIYLPYGFIRLDYIDHINDEGNHETLYAIGNPSSMKTGLWKFYNEKGKPETEQTYVKGNGEGLMREYHENGQKKSEGFFYENYFRKTGTWKEWDQTGKLIRELVYNDSGKLITEKK